MVVSLKIPAPESQPIRVIATSSQAFSRAQRQLHVFPLRYDWLIWMPAGAVIDQGNNFRSLENLSPLTCNKCVSPWSNYSPSSPVVSFVVRQIFFALLCSTCFCRLYCNCSAYLGFGVRHLVEDISKELLALTITKSVEKGFLRQRSSKGFFK